jgi:predicted regulator of Ras-like GTPase activity (Roadblock/LC7/MglB family)
MTKENIKILQALKRSSPEGFKGAFAVSEDNKTIEIKLERLRVNQSDFKGINDSFLDELKDSLNNAGEQYTVKMEHEAVIITEITEKKILLTLTIENTIALEEIKALYPDKTQVEILNELISQACKTIR